MENVASGPTWFAFFLTRLSSLSTSVESVRNSIHVIWWVMDCGMECNGMGSGEIGGADEVVDEEGNGPNGFGLGVGMGGWYVCTV